MRHYLLIPFFFIIICVSGQDFPEKPNPPRLVNDLANMLTASQEDALERKLLGYEDTTSTQIAIVTLNSLGVYEPADYAIQLSNRWGIGQKGKNNGVLILVSLKDRHSFIATGYGLEGALPDAYVARIRDEFLRANLKTGNYYEAFDQTTSAIFQLAEGEFKGSPINKEEKFSIAPFVIMALIFLFVILPMFRRGRQVRGSHFNGGGGGLGWLTTLFLMNSMGRGDRRSGGTWGDFTGGRGDFGGGGGFGGFGGGSFGGGGAGGDW
jgi:uncharacterized protein